MIEPVSWLVTCEHAGNRVPAEWRAPFAGRVRLLGSHRGFDAGALEVGRLLAKRLSAPLVYTTVTRLLVDTNRAETNGNVFSSVTRDLDEAARTRILERYHRPHRERVRAAVAEAVAAGAPVVHIASHSFTPVLRGQVRQVDVGLLYDPSRARERELCRRWADEIKRRDPRLRVRRNQPYRGTSDGLTRWLRGEFPDDDYAGIELEVNQRLWRGSSRRVVALRALLAESLVAAADDGTRADPRG